MVYKIEATSRDGEDPTRVASPSGGGIACEDYDQPVLGDESIKICECWYKDRPEQKSLFNLPVLLGVGDFEVPGGCGLIDFLPAWSYTEDPSYRPKEMLPQTTVTIPTSMPKVDGSMRLHTMDV
jgi:hypothetical protein